MKNNIKKKKQKWLSRSRVQLVNYFSILKCAPILPTGMKENKNILTSNENIRLLTLIFSLFLNEK